MTPTATKGEATRQAILERAVRLAAVDGLEGITVGQLALDLQMSKSGLFAHFKSKEALQVAVLEAAVKQFVDIVIRPALAAPRGEKRLRAVLDGWLQWGRDQVGGCIFLAASVEFDDHPGPVRDRVVTIQKDWIEFLSTCVRTGQDANAFDKSIDPVQIAWELYGLMLATHQASRLLQDPDAPARVRASIDRLLAGLQVRTTP